MIRLTRSPKPFTNSLTHLLQRCSVSNTPKGKTKLKTGQPLKRNKLTTKKGGKPTSTSATDGEELTKGKTRVSDEKQKLYEQCLTAPCPVRYLTPKEIERESQREKLGLISKDRQRDLDIQKKGALGDGSYEPMRIGTPGLDYVSLGIFDVEELPKYKLTMEEGERLAKESSRVLMKEHRERRAAETAFLGLKKAAIEALPEGLRVAALEPDLSQFPSNRGMASLTPPIEGYLETVMDAAKKSSSKEKLR